MMALPDMAIGYFGDESNSQSVAYDIGLLEDLSALGNLVAKRQLAGCFFHGNGTERKPYKALGLLKECYAAGKQSVLPVMYTMAIQLLSQQNGRENSTLPRALELLTAIELLAFAAKQRHARALIDFAILGEWFCKGIAPCPRNFSQGIQILVIASQLGNLNAKRNLTTKLFVYAAQEKKHAHFNLHLLANHFLAWEKLEPDYGIEQDVPTGLNILHYLEKHLLDHPAQVQLAQIRLMEMPVPKPHKSALEHFKGVLQELNLHIPNMTTQKIICEYLPEVNPVFFQYKNVPKPEDESVLLKCLNNVF